MAEEPYAKRARHMVMEGVPSFPAGEGMMEQKKEPKIPTKWTAEEDAALSAAVAEIGETNWKTIAERVSLVGDRTHVQCLQRYKKVLKPGLVKGQWTVAEDTMLINLVSNGFKNWGQLAQKMNGRTSKQCRERWSHHLDPSIKQGDWEQQEDELIVRMQSQLGNKWATIAKELPGRTENSVKIRYKALERAAGRNDGSIQNVRSRNNPSTQLRNLAARAAATAMAKRTERGDAIPAGFPQDPAIITKMVQMQQAHLAQSTLASQYLQSMMAHQMQQQGAEAAASEGAEGSASATRSAGAEVGADVAAGQLMAQPEMAHHLLMAHFAQLQQMQGQAGGADMEANMAIQMQMQQMAGQMAAAQMASVEAPPPEAAPVEASTEAPAVQGASL